MYDGFGDRKVSGTVCPQGQRFWFAQLAKFRSILRQGRLLGQAIAFLQSAVTYGYWWSRRAGAFERNVAVRRGCGVVSGMDVTMFGSLLVGLATASPRGQAGQAVKGVP